MSGESRLTKEVLSEMMLSLESQGFGLEEFIKNSPEAAANFLAIAEEWSGLYPEGGP
jgi:hypothetical protein